MQVIGLNAQSLQAQGSLEYTIRRSKLVQDVLKGTYECSEMRDILPKFPIEKQIEFLENQALFEAVAKILEKNNAMILEQLKAWQLLQQ